MNVKLQEMREEREGLLRNREYGCDNKHGKRCLIGKFFYYEENVTE